MERAGCAGGDQPSGPGADEVVRLCGACGFGLVSRTLGRLRDPPWGYYGPCARCSLKARSDRRGKRGPELRRKPKGIRREPQQSAARRAGPRHGPAISGEPEIEPTARRLTGAAFRTSACRRSAPLVFSGSGKGQRAAGALFKPDDFARLFDNRR